MAETSNYQLNQWEKTDRIQMEDFNADNRKVDAALAAETAARTAGDAALKQELLTVSARAGAQRLLHLTVPSPCAEYTFSLEGVHWEEWKLVHICLIPVVGDGRYMESISCRANAKGADLFSMTANSPATVYDAGQRTGHLLFFPLFNGDAEARAFCSHSETPVVSASVPYSKLTALSIQSSHSSTLIQTSTVLEVWGEK